MSRRNDDNNNNNNTNNSDNSRRRRPNDRRRLKEDMDDDDAAAAVPLEAPIRQRSTTTTAAGGGGGNNSRSTTTTTSVPGAYPSPNNNSTASTATTNKAVAATTYYHNNNNNNRESGTVMPPQSGTTTVQHRRRLPPPAPPAARMFSPANVNPRTRTTTTTTSTATNHRVAEEEGEEGYEHEYNGDIVKIATSPSISASSTDRRQSRPQQPPKGGSHSTGPQLPLRGRSDDGTTSSQATTSTTTVMPPPLQPLQRQQSTPGAIAVTGVFTTPRTPDYEANDFSDINTIDSNRTSLPSLVEVDHHHQSSDPLKGGGLPPPPPPPTSSNHMMVRNVSNHSHHNMFVADDSPLLVAELAPDEDMVAERIRDQISEEITQRLKSEVRQQLLMESGEFALSSVPAPPSPSPSTRFEQRHHNTSQNTALHTRQSRNDTALPVVVQAERMNSVREDADEEDEVVPTRPHGGTGPSKRSSQRTRQTTVTASASDGGSGNGSSHDSSSSKDNDQIKICGVPRACCGLFLFFLLLIAAGAGTGVYLYLSGFFDKDDGGGTDVQTTLLPTQSPTTTTKAPSAPQTSTEKRTMLVNLLSPYIMPQSEDAILSDGSPQYLALDWMSNDDEYVAELLKKYELEDFPLYDPSTFTGISATNPVGGNDEEETKTISTIVERYALVVLYYTNGAELVTQEPTTNWNIEFGRFADVSHCYWNTEFENVLITENNNNNPSQSQGVICSSDDDDDDSGSVQELQFANFGLQGELPWELSLLTALTLLDMDDNFLAGSIPLEYWRDLTEIEQFWFQSNYLEGSLPDAISRLSNLQSLDLNNNRFSGTLPKEWAGRLTNLRYLSLGLNNIGGTLPEEWGGGRSVAPSSALTKLEVWDMEGNDLGGSIPTEYGRLTNLVTLFLENNRLEGSLPSQISQLTNLKHLFLQNNAYLVGEIPGQYRLLTELEYFYFQGNMLEGSVDGMFCGDDAINRNDLDMIGDCLGDPAAVACSCCSVCCMGNAIYSNQTCLPQS